VQRSAVEAIQKIWDEGWDLEDKNQEARRFAILSQVNRALESGVCDLQLAAAEWLRRNAAVIARRERMVGRALGELTKIANDKNQDSDVRLEAREACQELWITSWATPENRETVLDQILYALNGQDDPEDAEFRHIATEWLGENAGGIVTNDRMVSKALEALIDRANNDPDQYTRRSAEESIGEIWDASWESNPKRDARHLIFVDQVMHGLNTSGTQGSHTKKAAVDWLGKKAEDIVQDNRLFHDVLDALVDSLDDEGDPVRPKGVDTMRKIWDKAWDPPEQRIEQNSVLNQVLKTLKKEDTETSDYRKIREVAAEWLQEKAQDIVRNERMLNDTLNVLFKKASPDERPNVRRTAKEASRKIWNEAWEASGGARGARDALRRIQANDPEEREALRLAVFNQVLNVLEKSPAQDFREQAANWLSDKASYLAESNRMVRDALKALRKWVVTREEADMMRSARDASRKIWNAGWKSQRQAVFEQVLKVIQDRRSRRNGWEFTQAAINFLVDKTGELVEDYDMAEKVADALYEIRNDSSLRDDLVESANRAMFAFWDALHKQYPLDALKRQFVNEDENEKIRTIRKLSNENTLGSREGVNFLVETWGQWIYLDQEPRLVELTTLQIRANEHAVLSLVEQFVKDWEEDQPKDFRRLLAALPGRSGRIKTTDSELDRERWLHVRRRIARQLADMSDPRFFEQDQANIYAEILQELKDHAVPVLVRRLPEEKDIEILEDIARALLYTQEREAIDALAKEVIGEERTRRARQDLLATYYLEPSKARSDQAADILNRAIQESKRTLRILQILNIAVVLVGLAVLFYGLYFSFLGDDAAQRILGGLAAVGGLSGIVYQLVRDPLNRIQNANSNLVQMETAFTSFIWELNLNGTFIQSSYVNNGELSKADIDGTVGRIGEAMVKTMDLVSIYTEEGKQRLVTRLNRLEPAAGKAGSTEITIHGQHLKGDSRQKTESSTVMGSRKAFTPSAGRKKEPAGMVAINHIPLASDGNEWDEHTVRFTLPGDLLGEPLPDTIRVSLFVDGMETNALPFQVIKDTTSGAED
jgi:hypothetical protein